MTEPPCLSSDPANLEEALNCLGTILWCTKGVSMRPLIVSGRDYVAVEKPSGGLKPMDVALYKRGGRYILHRVIGVEDGYYRILGDNCLRVERVPREAVIGVMTGLNRKGRAYDLSSWHYRAYVALWARPWRLRVGLKRFRDRLRRLAKRAVLTIDPDFREKWRRWRGDADGR